MESVIANPMAPAAYFVYTPEQTDARRHGAFIPQQPQQQQQPQAAYYYMMPATPTYSRPNSSSSQQPQPVLMSQPQAPKSFPHGAAAPFPAAAYIVGSNARRSVAGPTGKPTIMLETDFDVDGHGLRLPSTPPLSSTASSAIGSPSACDMLATPLNPMFSGLDSFEAAKDTANAVDVAAEQFNAAAWSNCASPPFTPVFVQGQSQSVKGLAPTSGLATPAALTSDLLSVSACPSLSPSPSPYARSVASEQGNDFCDPRNLTVSGSEGSLSPTFSAIQTSLSPAADAEDDFNLKQEHAPSSPLAASPAPVAADFIPSNLSVLEEFPDLESEDDFVNTLVNLGTEFSSASSIASADLSLRSRASSSVTAHSEIEFFDSWESTSFDSSESHSSKRQRTSSGSFLAMSTVPESDAESAAAASDNTEAAATEAHEPKEAEAPTGEAVAVSGESATPEGEESTESVAAPVPTNRRGRKQSLTEDPSKIFACDLCNRRFRRQEHLKRHYRSLHTHDKPFNCHECGKKFSRSDNLAQHARTHGAGAMVMNVFDEADMVAAVAGGYMPHMMYPGHPAAMGGDDYSGMGRVLFQVASEIPGSASEHSSDDSSDGQKKKRKRTD
ncbi:uncharacterized protein SPSK_02296 [Sporothrix schenckii 1099-18]|uniref:C2H2-type domain-containing protein n=1 Tax=Sporothrix schenckii 1099-18 TaxID=1397361 RepID=A0A0F2MAR5_SPOSC|nr:uncharacterized protein SPSK_02296 [Sporothrix schenckii 1099-18]KJR86788.1 hypothetical protein SPSK_02296 [Sporothrix schenckii 1099-18]